MKTLCPNCSMIQDAPDEYAGREIQCWNCKKEFTATEYSQVIHRSQSAPKPPSGPSHIADETPGISYALWAMSIIIIIISAIGGALYQL